jgi:hypothetical protein
MKAIAPKSAIDLLVDGYHEHLTDVAGLQPSSCQKWTFFVRLFLNAQFRPKAPVLELDHLKPEVLLAFVLQQAKHYRPGQLQSLASALRSFCRFLCVTGRHAQDLSAALPSISGHLPDRIIAGKEVFGRDRIEHVPDASGGNGGCLMAG